MAVFISWSGNGGQVAEAFAELLRHTLQGVRAFVSKRDIGSGKIWFQQIQDSLEAAKFGVLITTPDALVSPWVMFEAGAIWKGRDASLAALLVGLSAQDLARSPLDHFQARAANSSGISVLMKDIRTELGLNVEDDVVEAAVIANWSKFQAVLDAFAKAPSPTAQRSDPIQEILVRLGGLEKFLIQQDARQQAEARAQFAALAAQYFEATQPRRGLLSVLQASSWDKGGLGALGAHFQEEQDRALREAVAAKIKELGAVAGVQDDEQKDEPRRG